MSIFDRLGREVDGNPTTLPNDGTLTALSNLDGVPGILVETLADTFTKRTMTGTANEITVTNGDGVSGGPNISLPTALTFSGKTITGGTFTGVVSFNGNIWTAGTGTLTLGAGKTATISNTLTFTGTDTSSVAFGTGGTVAYTGSTLAQFAATTSLQLLGVISDETGTGSLVFANTPTLVTPVLGAATATSINKVTITAPATSATLTLIDGTVLTGPTATGTLMSKTSADVMTNKTLDSAGTGNVLKVSGVTVSAGQYPGTTTNDNATAGNVGELISVQAPYDAVGATVTITIASPGVITWTAHGLVNTVVDGNIAVPVFFTTTGALPTGIVANTTYYVIGSSITTNTFQIATTIANALAGTAINTSGSQSGVQTALKGLRIGTTSTAVDVAGISLAAGDWDVGGLIQIQPIASATITLVESYVSTVSVTRAASPAGGTYFFDQQSKTAGTGIASYIGKRRISLSATTTVYFGAFTQFTGTALNITAYLGARRVR